MRRRKFLKLSSAASVLTMLPTEVYSLFRSVGIESCPNTTGKKIVLIQLAGANDGLNTLVPLNQYDHYANLRPNLKLNNTGSNAVINLDTTLAIENQVGLHPVMTGFKDLYDKGLVRIIQGVGYPNINLSHFKSTDLWLSGGDGTYNNFNYDTGWMARFIENQYSDALTSTYPMGIQMGSGENSLGFHGTTEHMLSTNITNQDVSGFYSVINGLGGTPPETIPDSEYGDLVRFLVNLDASTNVYSQAISNAFNAGQNTVSYPQNDLSNQLKTVARFISGGLQTKVYLVRLGGFDTHEGQVPTLGGTHIGWHANQLEMLSSAVNAFITDLNNLNRGEEVLTMTFSEFGRKVAENGSFGTDHGEVAPLFIFGKSVNPGISGTNIDLNEANADNDFHIQTVQHDYRSVFSTVMQDWLGAKNETLDATFYDRTTQSGFWDKKVPGIFNSANLVPPRCYDGSVEPEPPPVKGIVGIAVSPNPCTNYITATAALDNEIYALTLYADDSRKINYCPATTLSNTLTVDVSHLSSGLYFLKIETKKETFTKKIYVRR
jgi:uncharacterized protein (DUF1501 family)